MLYIGKECKFIINFVVRVDRVDDIYYSCEIIDVQ